MKPQATQLDWVNEVYHIPDWDPGKTCRVCGRRWVAGSQNFHGTAGAPGRLTHVSEILGPVPIDVSITPAVGLSKFQGRVWDISLRSSEGPGDGFILMAYFDFETASRLLASRCGKDGMIASDAVRYSLTIVREAPRTT